MEWVLEGGGDVITCLVVLCITQVYRFIMPPVWRRTPHAVPISGRPQKYEGWLCLPRQRDSISNTLREKKGRLVSLHSLLPYEPWLSRATLLGLVHRLLSARQVRKRTPWCSHRSANSLSSFEEVLYRDVIWFIFWFSFLFSYLQSGGPTQERSLVVHLVEIR